MHIRFLLISFFIFFIVSCSSQGIEFKYEAKEINSADFLKQHAHRSGYQFLIKALETELQKQKINVTDVTKTMEQLIDHLLKTKKSVNCSLLAGYIASFFTQSPHQKIKTHIKKYILKKKKRILSLFTSKNRILAAADIYLRMPVSSTEKSQIGGLLITSGLYNLMKENKISNRRQVLKTLKLVLKYADKEEVLFTIKKLYGKFKWKHHELHIPRQYKKQIPKNKSNEKKQSDYDRILKIL